MAANEAQFYAVSATGASLGAMAGGLDLAFIAGIVNKLDGDFVVSSKVAAPADLKGKLLGVQSIGRALQSKLKVLNVCSQISLESTESQIPRGERFLTLCKLQPEVVKLRFHTFRKFVGFSFRLLSGELRFL